MCEPMQIGFREGCASKLLITKAEERFLMRSNAEIRGGEAVRWNDGFDPDTTENNKP